MKYPGKTFKKICGATDGMPTGHLFGRCNLPAGHGGGERSSWHLEMRGRRVWANWRGPNPGVKCDLCGLDGRGH